MDLTPFSRTWFTLSFLVLSLHRSTAGEDSSTSLTVESSTSSDGFAEESTVSEVPLSSVSPGHPELRNLSAPLGSSIHLPCPVKLHQGFIRATAYPRVSWIRRKDWHILTVGRKEYTSDQRFRVVHREGSLDWLLQIKYLQSRDSGLYECQVTMGSLTTRHLVNLEVLEAEAELDGGAERHLEEGSSILLVCRVQTSIPPPAYIFWYKENQMVNYDHTNRLSVSVDHLEKGMTEAKLQINSATIQDSGNYTCSPANSKPAHVSVFVNKGDKMQPRKSKGDTSAGLPSSLDNLFLKLFFIFYTLYRGP